MIFSDKLSFIPQRGHHNIVCKDGEIISIEADLSLRGEDIHITRCPVTVVVGFLNILAGGYPDFDGVPDKLSVIDAWEHFDDSAIAQPFINDVYGPFRSYLREEYAQLDEIFDKGTVSNKDELTDDLASLGSPLASVAKYVGTHIPIVSFKDMLLIEMPSLCIFAD